MHYLHAYRPFLGLTGLLLHNNKKNNRNLYSKELIRTTRGVTASDSLVPCTCYAMHTPVE